MSPPVPFDAPDPHPRGERRRSRSAGGVIPAERHLVLMGSMGSGKSTIGRVAAERLGRPFFDSDDDLVAMFDTDAATIEKRYGIDRLHDIEADLLHRRLCSPVPSVIAAAASTIEVPRC